MSDGFSPEVSTASTETPSTPSEGAVSATVQPEATQMAAQPAIEAQPEPAAAESAPAAPEVAELPDEQAFEQLTGPERGNNWKQARARIAELNSKVSAFTAHQPVIEQINERGGWDTVQQYADLGQLLFSQVEDPNTGQIQLTAEPLIERLASESPNTLGEIVWKGIHQPSPWVDGETIGHTFVRDYLGLDPNLLETYRQIQSPADAQKFMAPGQVTADELAAIPDEFHDAYKSLTPQQRKELTYADEETLKAFLQDKADALQARKFIAEQNVAKEQAKQEQARQFKAMVQQRGQEIAQSVRDAVLSTAKQKLQAGATFSADADVNESVHNEAIQWAVQQCLADPALAQDSERSEKLYELSADAELRGDKIRASQYRLQADALAKKLEGRFLTNLTKRTAFWSKALGASRAAQQQQVEQARPRTEIASNNQPRPNQQTPTVGRGNGFMPTPQRMQQYEEMLRAQQMRNG